MTRRISEISSRKFWQGGEHPGLSGEAISGKIGAIVPV